MVYTLFSQTYRSIGEACLVFSFKRYAKLSFRKLKLNMHANHERTLGKLKCILKLLRFLFGAHLQLDFGESMYEKKMVNEEKHEFFFEPYFHFHIWLEAVTLYVNANTDLTPPDFQWLTPHIKPYQTKLYICC